MVSGQTITLDSELQKHLSSVFSHKNKWTGLEQEMKKMRAVWWSWAHFLWHNGNYANETRIVKTLTQGDVMQIAIVLATTKKIIPFIPTGSLFNCSDCRCMETQFSWHSGGFFPSFFLGDWGHGASFWEEAQWVHSWMSIILPRPLLCQDLGRKCQVTIWCTAKKKKNPFLETAKYSDAVFYYNGWGWG